MFTESNERFIKRIVEGTTYNSETSQLLHEHKITTDNALHRLQLYKTRTGEFFLVQRDEPYNDYSTDTIKLRDSVIPMSPDLAIRWVAKYCPELSEQLFSYHTGEVSTTLTLRLPGSVNHPALKGGAWSQKTTSQVEAGKAVSNPLR